MVIKKTTWTVFFLWYPEVKFLKKEWTDTKILAIQRTNLKLLNKSICGILWSFSSLRHCFKWIALFEHQCFLTESHIMVYVQTKFSVSYQGTTFIYSLINLISICWALLPFTTLGVIISMISLKFLPMKFVMFYRESVLTMPKQQYILPKEWFLNGPPFATAQRRILINGKENRVANRIVICPGRKRDREPKQLSSIFFH